MGVSGCGKSTIARALAQQLSGIFLEGDAFHSTDAVAKMETGTPLTDDDRWPWLDRIGVAARDARTGSQSVVISCSALRRAYRDRLRAGIGPCAFALLNPPRAVLAQRVAGRRGHFMPPDLLDSQLSTLEPLEADELGVTLDRELTAQATVADILAWRAQA